MNRKQSFSGASRVGEPTGRTYTGSSMPRRGRGGVSGSDRPRESQRSSAKTEGITERISLYNLDWIVLQTWLERKFPKYYSRNPLQPPEIMSPRDGGLAGMPIYENHEIAYQYESDDESHVPGRATHDEYHRIPVPRKLTPAEMKEIDSLRSIPDGELRRQFERNPETDDEEEEDEDSVLAWDSDDRNDRQTHSGQRDAALRFDRLSLKEVPSKPRSQPGRHNDPSSSSIDPSRTALANNAAFWNSNTMGSSFPTPDSEAGFTYPETAADNEPDHRLPTDSYYENRTLSNAAFANNNAAFLNNNAIALNSAMGDGTEFTNTRSPMYNDPDDRPATNFYSKGRFAEVDSPSSNRGGRNANRNSQGRATQSSAQRSHNYT